MGFAVISSNLNDSKFNLPRLNSFLQQPSTSNWSDHNLIQLSKYHCRKLVLSTSWLSFSSQENEVGGVTKYWLHVKPKNHSWSQQ